MKDSRDERLAYLEKLVHRIYCPLVQEIIADMKALPNSCHQSRHSLPLNVWEDYKFQVKSGLYDAYENTIQPLCLNKVAKLDPVYKGLLWLGSEGYWFCNGEDETHEIPFGDEVDAALEEELCQRVRHAAQHEKVPPTTNVEC